MRGHWLLLIRPSTSIQNGIPEASFPSTMLLSDRDVCMWYQCVNLLYLAQPFELMVISNLSKIYNKYAIKFIGVNSARLHHYTLLWYSAEIFARENHFRPFTKACDEKVELNQAVTTLVFHQKFQ